MFNIDLPRAATLGGGGGELSLAMKLESKHANMRWIHKETTSNIFITISIKNLLEADQLIVMMVTSLQAASTFWAQVLKFRVDLEPGFYVGAFSDGKLVEKMQHR